MKAVLQIGFLVLLTTEASGQSSAPGSITVTVTGGENSAGHLMIAIEKEPQAFEMSNISKPLYRGQFTQISDGAATVVFHDVPTGKFAVKVFHDANANHKLDTNLFGMPTEAYGFSRGARSAFGPPEFDDAAFEFSNNRSEVVNIQIK